MAARTLQRATRIVEESRTICADLCAADLALSITMLDQLVHTRSARDRTRIYEHAERSLATVRSILRRLKLKRAPEQRIRALAQGVVARLKREREIELRVTHP